jgi:hypothetical protein
VGKNKVALVWVLVLQPPPTPDKSERIGVKNGNSSGAWFHVGTAQ